METEQLNRTKDIYVHGKESLLIGGRNNLYHKLIEICMTFVVSWPWFCIPRQIICDLRHLYSLVHTNISDPLLITNS